ncbi:MAG: SDR family NAD(P)-dependent oxidoreductase, partial [Acidobacteriota bacterium]|nr:SDR family NAD(P)-dependent oxidoreductase [Acidobacteriota bacterium]
ALARECLSAQAERGALLTASMRAGRGEPETLMRALAEVHAHGVDVDWSPLLAPRGPRLVALPTYPFERERHWLTSDPADGAAGVAGGAPAGRALLGAGMRLADRDAWVFSGRVSLQTHPWLADHTVLGAVALPASAFLGLALHAGRDVGCEEVAELTLDAPLAIPEEGVVEVQVSVSETGEGGRRAVLIASRGPHQDGAGSGEWTRQAHGELAPAGSASPTGGPGEPWPPPGAEPIELEHLQDRLAELGVSHGSAFARLRAAWLHEDVVLVEIEPAGEDADADLLADPALVDAILQATMAELGASTGAGVLAPCAWSGVSARPVGSAALRARIGVSGKALALAVSDEDGLPVLSIAAVLMAPLDAGLLRSGGGSERDLLLGLEWVRAGGPAGRRELRGVAVLGDAEIDAIAAPRHADLSAVADALGAGASLRSLLVPLATDDESPAGVRDGVHRTHALLRRLLADEELRDLHVVFLTVGAVAAHAGETPNLAGAAVWGLVRSAQSEQPARFTLADLDGSVAAWEALRWALALQEPQLAIRDDQVLLPRLSRWEEPLGDGSWAPDPGGTVLVTGGTGGLGRLVARHLARAHGVRHLLLASRSGPEADGVAELQAELAELGCDARVVACDVADRGALERLLAGIPASEPLTAVVHAAGVHDDGLIEALDRGRIERAIAPKVDAAIALDELTAEHELRAFILISSAVATLGDAGQANSAAANAVLDAIAQRRRVRGLAGQSLAFGPWQPEAGMAAGRRGDALARLESQVRTRIGMLALEPERGLALFDASLAAGGALLLPVRVDMDILRANAQVDAISPVLLGLVRRPRKRADSPRALRRRLLSTASAEREPFLCELVAEEVA